MAREFDLSKPLSAKDIVFLRSRHHDSYVDRMIELAGVQETDDQDTQVVREDLIGVFDPSSHTADEVVEYFKSASDEEKDRVIAVEADGKGRSTILKA